MEEFDVMMWGVDRRNSILIDAFNTKNFQCLLKFQLKSEMRRRADYPRALKCPHHSEFLAIPAILF